MTQLWDSPTALINVGGDLEDLKELLLLMLEQAPDLIADIASAIQENNPAKLYLAAHTLKSSLQLLGFDASGEIASALELAGRTQQIESCDDLLLRLQMTTDLTIVLIRDYISS